MNDGAGTYAKQEISSRPFRKGAGLCLYRQRAERYLSGLRSTLVGHFGKMQSHLL